MLTSGSIRLRRVSILLAASTLSFTGVSLAAGPGGGGGAHGGGGHSGAQGGAVHGFAAHGFYGHGYYGHGYYGHGYYPGYPGHPWYPYHYCCAYGGWWGPWWWGPGWWGLGVYVPVLPYYYSSFWYNGYPYYYADNSYYVWNGDAGQYEQVNPPNGAQPGAAGAPGEASLGSDLFAYPKAGQSEEQQTRDRDECRRWAQQVLTQAGPGAAAAAPPPGAAPGQPGAQVAPEGTPPSAAPPSTALPPPPPPTTPAPGASGPPAGNAAPSEPLVQHESYLRAEAACLEARNYAVR